MGAAVSLALDATGKIEVGVAMPAAAVEVVKADLAIAADGFNSTVRRMLLPRLGPEDAEYIALRGTVPERELPSSAAAVCVKMAFYNAKGTQAIAYAIPSCRGSLEPGNRLVNWVWYRNCRAGSDDDRDIMTDVAGTRHRTTVPPGKLNPAVWARQLQVAASQLPPQFVDVVRGTAEPFVQRIMDVAVPRCAFQDGRVLLIGDAAFGLRPHTGSSTEQADFHALNLAKLLQGSLDSQ